jgi:beta-glucanase (GH16 family)
MIRCSLAPKTAKPRRPARPRTCSVFTNEVRPQAMLRFKSIAMNHHFTIGNLRLVVLFFGFSAGCGSKIVQDNPAHPADAAGVTGVSDSSSGSTANAGDGATGTARALVGNDAGDPDASSPGSRPLDAAVDVPSIPGWRFVWSDEFAGPNIDESIWVIADEPGNSHNKELQYYTPRKNAEPGANAFIQNGSLVLEAREEMYSGFAYTSAKLTTQGTKESMYGRFEASIKLPAVTGMWPAFWMLGSNIQSVGWPASGEVDIVEGKGRLPNWMSGALHRGAQGIPDIVTVQSYVLPSGTFNDSWHVFAVEWDNQLIRWYVDNVQLQVVGRPLTAGQPWPFDQPFFLLLNLAVGGIFDQNAVPPPGMPPQRVYVDYVRVYQR